MSALRAAWSEFATATKATAASITDLLATVGERAPALAQLTVSAGGVTVTVNPKPEAPRACSTCGKS